MRRFNSEYKHHEQLIAEHLTGFEHDEESKKIFNKKYAKWILLLLLLWLPIVPAFFILKFKVVYLMILFPLPILGMLLLKLHQAKFSTASCAHCNSEMKVQSDPIVGVGQKLYTCESCKKFFCISYAQKGQKFHH